MRAQNALIGVPGGILGDGSFPFELQKDLMLPKLVAGIVEQEGGAVKLKASAALSRSC